MTRASLYDHAEVYDLLFAPDVEVIEFYAEQARRAGGPVLELGCGTGGVLIPIARHGVEATGLDVAPDMLARAAAAARVVGASVRLVEGDMCNFDLQQRFALIFVASNSLSHLADLTSLRRFFRAARRHLAPGARLVFDVSHPDVRALALPGDDRRKHEPVTHSQWGELGVEEQTSYDAATQLTRSLWHLRSVRARRALTFALQLRNFFPCELELLVEANGYALAQRFGDFNGAAFTADSRHQICVCQSVDPGLNL